VAVHITQIRWALAYQNHEENTMKKNLLALGTGLLAVVMSAGTAKAETVSFETRFIDRVDGTEAEEYLAKYTHNGYMLDFGTEVSYATSDTGDTTKITESVGVQIAAPGDVVIGPYVEVGYALKPNEDGAFWGIGSNITRDFGPLTAVVGLRHRSGFDDNLDMDEDRLNAGLRYNFNDHHSIGLNYYHTFAETDSQAIGVSYRFAFGS
jgi:hypothetical protein